MSTWESPKALIVLLYLLQLWLALVLFSRLAREEEGTFEIIGD